MTPEEVLVVGHYCHDTLIHPEGQSQALGGSSAYISSILESLNVSHSVVAKVGEDFRYSDKVAKKPLISRLKTTHFTADFTRGERELYLNAACEEIRPEDIRTSAKVALACALHGEIQPETLKKIVSVSDFTLCDVQGLIRNVDGDGRIVHRPLSETPYIDLIDGVFVLKASTSEARFMDIDRIRARTRVIVTEGSAGCTLYEAASSFRFPAIPVKEVDPTGAGDCFMAGLAYGLVQGLSLAESCEIANRCGAKAVSQVGVPRL